MLHVVSGSMTLSYDASVDVLYVRIGSPLPSYSVGNPANIEGVEWMVAESDGESVTGAIITDWKKSWATRLPPLPFAIEQADLVRAGAA